MSCHGFFLVGYKEFGSLLTTDCTSAVNIFGEASQGVKKVKCYAYWFVFF
jgi:hypothetical protein